MNGPMFAARVAATNIAMAAVFAGTFAVGALGQDEIEPGKSDSKQLRQEATFFYDTLIDGKLTGGKITVDLSDARQREQFGADLPVGHRMPAWPVTTIRNNGPSENRIDLVLVGDGYTSRNLSQYASHVDAILGQFFAQEPLAGYSTYFNVHRVDVVSNDSGVDELDRGMLRDTALDMVYGCFGVSRALCVNVSKARAAAASAPEADQVLAIANSTRYGGAGYPASDLGTVAGNNSSAMEIALHEFGHALGDLHDEYGYGGSGAYTGPEWNYPNVSIYDAATLEAQQRKWCRWLDLPNVDAFQGAAYYESGVYRPTDNSKMRNLGQPFEQVNSEQLVMSIYRMVSPVDDATPASTTARSACNPLFVTPHQPADHDLSVRWFLNSQFIPGASTVFHPLDYGLPVGISTVRVVVVDETSRVRDEDFRNQYMTFTREWRVRYSEDPGACVCEPASAVQTGLVATPVNRYISFIPKPGAIRVQMLELMRPRPSYLPNATPPSYAELEGEIRWVGPPQRVADSPDLSTAGSFFAAKLQCEPYYHDWSTIPMLHVTGPEIVPSSRYAVQVIDEGCDESVETDYSNATLLTTGRWGDVVRPFQGPTLPITQPDVLDIAAIVNRVATRPGAMPRVRVQLQPADIPLVSPVGVLDVAACSSAMQGRPFPFPPPTSCE